MPGQGNQEGYPYNWRPYSKKPLRGLDTGEN